MEWTKKIWIDLENSPHVLFFNPIIKELKQRGYRVVVTVRDYAQVCDLVKLFNIEHHKIGRHYGKHNIFKIFGLISRTLQLFFFIRKEKPNLAFNHGSRSQFLTTKLINIPSITALDYEHSKCFPFIKPTLNIMPQVLYEKMKRENGRRIASYPGIKEDVYVNGFIPDASIVDSIHIDQKRVVATIRPPATEAHYHNTKSDDLFKAVIEYLCSKKEVQTIIVPRTRSQERRIRKMWPENFAKSQLVIPRRAVNGLDLIWHSDLVISGGGTMIREAAALHVPAYSFFQSKIGAVDQYLSDCGRLILIENKDDVHNKIEIKHRQHHSDIRLSGCDTLQCIVDKVDVVLKRSSQIHCQPKQNLMQCQGSFIRDPNQIDNKHNRVTSQ